MSQRRDFARRAIGGFLNHMASMAARPVPFYLMFVYSFVEPLPPILICLATITTFPRLDHVARIGVQTHMARFFQSFQAQRRGGNLGLLIRRFAEVQTERPPQSAIAEQGNS